MGSDQFCLKWTNYQNNMVQALGRLKVSENLRNNGYVNSSSTTLIKKKSEYYSCIRKLKKEAVAK
jgi:hypothetical protein